MAKLLLPLTLLAFSSGVLCNRCKCDNTAADEWQCAAIDQALAEKGKRQLCVEIEPGNGYRVIKGFGAYKLNIPGRPWNEARKACMAEKAQLAVINSEAEATMLLDWMRHSQLWHAWIGTHGYFGQNNWVTLNGESLNAAGYDTWLPGEPNNADGEEHCGSLVTDGGMNDINCDSTLSYICKINMCADSSRFKKEYPRDKRSEGSISFRENADVV